jgi:hypothetical protein
MDAPQPFDFSGLRRGDTFEQFPFFQTSQDGSPLEIQSARMQVRTVEGRKVVLSWDSADDSILLSGSPTNIVTLAEKTAEVTKNLAVGDHEYDIEVTFASGRVLTIFAGLFPITEDITR